MKLKIWFFFLRIKKAFRKFHNLSIFKKLRKSFAYTFLKMFAIILAVLWLQFLIIPHRGYIDVADPLSASDLEISFSELNMEAQHGLLAFAGFGQLDINIHDAKFSIGDYEYTSDIVISIPNRQVFRLFDIYYGDNSELSFSSSSTMHYSETMKEENYFCSFIEGVERSIIFSDDSIKFLFIGCDANLYLINNDMNMTRGALIAENISELTIEEFWLVEILGNYVMQIDNCPRGEDSYKLIFDDIDELSCRAIGTITFNDIPKIKEYDVLNQIVSFVCYPNESKAERIQAYNVNQLYVNGCVFDASIAGYNLFPSFRNWYYDNLYIAPLTLLSVVISSVAIIFKKRNKE